MVSTSLEAQRLPAWVTWQRRPFPDANLLLLLQGREPTLVEVAELRRCVETSGFRALRILPWLWGLPPDDKRYYPLLAACCELDVTFCTQVGHAGPLRSSAPGRDSR